MDFAIPENVEGDSVEPTLCEVLNLVEALKENKVRAKFTNIVGNTSHTLRKAMLKIAYTAKLDMKAIQGAYFLTTICRNRERLLKVIDELPTEVKTIDLVLQGIKFIMNCTVAWVNDENLDRNIATVHIPNTNPSCCLFWWKLISEDSERTMEKMLATQYITQIGIPSHLQAINKAYIKAFWKNIKKTRNPKSGAAFKSGTFNDEFYKTAASDHYPFVICTGGGLMKVIRSPTRRFHYNQAEVEAWLAMPMLLPVPAPDEATWEVIGDKYYFKAGLTASIEVKGPGGKKKKRDDTSDEETEASESEEEEEDDFVQPSIPAIMPPQAPSTSGAQSEKGKGGKKVKARRTEDKEGHRPATRSSSKSLEDEHDSTPSMELVPGTSFLEGTIAVEGQSKPERKAFVTRKMEELGFSAAEIALYFATVNDWETRFVPDRMS